MLSYTPRHAASVAIPYSRARCIRNAPNPNRCRDTQCPRHWPVAYTPTHRALVTRYCCWCSDAATHHLVEPDSTGAMRVDPACAYHAGIYGEFYVEVIRR